MLRFELKNVNPKRKKTGDCSVRALVTVLDKSYEECAKLEFEESMKTYYAIGSKECLERILKNFGFVKMKQPRKLSGKKYTVKELDLITTKDERDKGIFVLVSNHATAVKGNSVIDIWDCRDKTICNYWIKS